MHPSRPRIQIQFLGVSPNHTWSISSSLKLAYRFFLGNSAIGANIHEHRLNTENNHLTLTYYTSPYISTPASFLVRQGLPSLDRIQALNQSSQR